MNKSTIKDNLLTKEYHEFLTLSNDDFINKHYDNLTGGIVYFASATSEKYQDEINLGIEYDLESKRLFF